MLCSLLRLSCRKNIQLKQLSFEVYIYDFRSTASVSLESFLLVNYIFHLLLEHYTKIMFKSCFLVCDKEASFGVIFT